MTQSKRPPANPGRFSFYVRQQNATVVVPEVVRLELERHLFRELCRFAASVETGHRKLLTVFGNLKEVVVPNESAIRQKVTEIIPQLDVPIKDLPFSLDAARSSFLKTIDKEAPSDRTQEFKDGVIWAHCIDLLSEADVFLVTGDKAFYEGRDYSSGLAKNLGAEAMVAPYKLTLLKDLADLLKGIRQDIQIDKEKLVQTFLGLRSSNTGGLLDRHGFAMGDLFHVDVKLFATEEATRLYVEFTIRFRCEDVLEEGRTDAVLELQGSGSYNPSTKEYAELRSQGESFTFTDKEGQQQKRSVVVAAADMVIGHRTVRHTVKVPL